MEPNTAGFLFNEVWLFDTETTNNLILNNAFIFEVLIFFEISLFA